VSTAAVQLSPWRWPIRGESRRSFSRASGARAVKYLIVSAVPWNKHQWIKLARYFAQIPGTSAKMSRRAFAQAMQSMPAFQRLATAYVQAFLEQVMISVACNGAHNVKERLARWLLMMRDRSDDDP
jgi:hypothetical protein